MAINRQTRPVYCVVLVWRRRRVHPGDDVPKLHNVGAASPGRHVGYGSRRAGRGGRRPKDDEMSDLMPSSPSRPRTDDGDDDADDGCESEGSSGSEYDADLFEPAEPPPPPLDAVFAPVAQSLADEALSRFLSASPVHSPPPFSRASPQHHHHYNHDVPPTMTPTTYACPYYVRDPIAHAPCRPNVHAGGSSGFFPRLLDLRRHLQTAHRRPPWCPACGARFARAAARDAHVRALACRGLNSGAPSSSSVVALPPPPGLAEPQLRRLARRPDPAVPAPQQWAALWRLCFDEAAETPPASPPADVVVVARARAFWARNRHAIVTAAAAGPAAAGNRAALEAAVLERMLETLLRDAGRGAGEATCSLEPLDDARVGAAL